MALPCPSASKIQRLPFTTQQVPRLAMNDPRAFAYIQNERPVILTNVSLVKPLVGKWTTDYLAQHVSADMDCTVFTSDSQFFQYWDGSKNMAGYEFTPPTQKVSMPFRKFVETIRREGDSDKDVNRKTDSQKDTNSKTDKTMQYYLQQMLVTGMGDQILQDFKEVDWATIYAWKDALDFGELTTNLLLVGQKGHVTPAHYDEQHNFFSQLEGRKQVLLYAPSDWDKLYPYPVHHACDRQSQVDLFKRGVWPTTSTSQLATTAAFDEADAAKYPKFARATAFEACVLPGEMLYIPSYWWHHIWSLEETVSLTFWFKCGPPASITLPISAMQKVALRRNIETQMANLGGGGKSVRELLQAMEKGLLSDAQTSILAQVKLLLKHVLAEHEIQDFLEELAAHRFDLPLLLSHT